MAKTRVKADPTVVQMQLKVTLLDLRPGIWRRLVVPAKIKLPKLHDVLQCAFDWTDSHMHAFRLGAETYQELAPQEPELGPFDSGEQHDERKFRLCDLLHAPKDWLIYEYDFGDSWEHEVLLEKLLPSSAGRTVSCLAGARAGPPEDCGGAPGYGHLLEVLANPRHPDREELLEWVGESHDPDAFDREALNKVLATLKV